MVMGVLVLAATSIAIVIIFGIGSLIFLSTMLVVMALSLRSRWDGMSDRKTDESNNSSSRR